MVTQTTSEAVINATNFDDFFLDQYRSVFKEVLWVTVDREKATELTQEAFYRTLLRWEKIRRYDRPGAYVRLVALRLAYKKGRDVVSLEQYETLTTASSDDLSALRVDVWKAIGQLKAFYRSVIVLHYFDDMTTAEIADGLKKSESNVKVALHRAREALRPMLESTYGSVPTP